MGKVYIYRVLEQSRLPMQGSSSVRNMELSKNINKRNSEQSNIINETPPPLKKLKTGPSLPEETILETISRLPAKSLLQFMSVCKSWNNLRFNSWFVNLCKNRSIQNEKISLFIASKQGCYDLHSPPNFHSPGQPRQINHFLHGIRCVIRSGTVVGSCNGVVCLSTVKNNFLLLNPSTRWFTKLPVPLVPFQYQGYWSRYPSVMGFGYNDLTREYKVVSITFFQQHLGFIDVEKTDVQVYTIGTKSWRRISDIPPASVWHETLRASFINGSLYWMAKESHFSSTTILAFHINEEKFSIVPLPKRIDWGRSYDILCLSEFGGSLCMLHNSRDDKLLELWVMKESWSRQFCITPPEKLLQMDKYIMRFKLLHSGEILLMTRIGDVIVYNPKSGNFTDLILWSVGENLIICNSKKKNLRALQCETIDYMETLVSVV